MRLSRILLLVFASSVMAAYGSAPEPVNDIVMLKAAVSEYSKETGAIPSVEDGLSILAVQPANLAKEEFWSPVIKKLPIDPWGNEYQYVVGESIEGGFGIYSYGGDGVSSSLGNDPDDWNSWGDRFQGIQPDLRDHRGSVVLIGLAGVVGGLALGYIIAKRKPKHRTYDG